MRNIILALCALLMVSTNVIASSLPKKSDRAFVVDMSCKEEKVCIVSKAANDLWTSQAADIQKRTGVQAALIVIHGTGGISFEQYANDAANLLKVGTRGNGGVVFLFDNKEHKSRLEVSRDLEGVIPDIAAKRIVELFSETLGQDSKSSNPDALAKSLVAVLDSIDNFVTEYHTQKGGKVFVAEKDKSFTYFAIICSIVVLLSSFVAVLWYSKRWYYTKGSLLGGTLCVLVALFFQTLTVSSVLIFVIAFVITFILAWIWHSAGDSAGWDIIDSAPSGGANEVKGSMAEGVSDFAGGGATEVVSSAVHGVTSTASSAAESCDISGCDLAGCDVGSCDIGGCDL